MADYVYTPFIEANTLHIANIKVASLPFAYKNTSNPSEDILQSHDLTKWAEGRVNVEDDSNVAGIVTRTIFLKTSMYLYLKEVRASREHDESAVDVVNHFLNLKDKGGRYMYGNAADREMLFRHNKLVSELAEGITNIDYGVYRDVIAKAYNDIINSQTFSLQMLERFVVDNLEIPSDIPKEFDVNLPSGYTEEKTYTHRQYVELATIMLFIRITSIINVFSITANKLYHNDNIKVAWPNIINLLPYSIMEHPGYKRFVVFVNGVSQGNEPSIKDVVNLESGTDDLLPMTLGKNLFITLSSTPIIHTGIKQHVISVLYSKIDKGGMMSGDFSKNYQSKNIKTSDNNEDDVSPFEAFRVGTFFTIAETEILELAGTFDHVYPKVEKLIDTKLFRDVYAYLKRTVDKGGFVTKKLHTYLLTGIFKNIIPVGGIYYVDRKNLVFLLSLGYCLLEKNHPYIALTLISTPVLQENVIYEPSKSRLNSTMTQELKKKVDLDYPWNNTNICTTPKAKAPEHPVVAHIGSIMRDITDNKWVLGSKCPDVINKHKDVYLNYDSGDYILTYMSENQSNLGELIYDCIKDTNNIVPEVSCPDIEYI